MGEVSFADAALVLVLPPQWTPQNPPFALASLGGHLRSRGIETRLVDLNLEYFLEILTPAHMQYIRQVTAMRRDLLLQKMRLRSMLAAEASVMEEDATHLMRIDQMVERGDVWSEVARRLPSALDTLRHDQHFYNPDRLLGALNTVDMALELAALPYHPSQLALNNFYNQSYRFSLESLESATRDAWGNPFLTYMRSAAARVLSHGAKVVALSINAFSQVVPGLTLARFLKEQKPVDVHLTIGGNFFGRVADRLEKMPRFFELFCDSMVVGEGEDSLARLVRAVGASDDIGQAGEAAPHDTLYFRDGKIHRTPRPKSRMPLPEAGFLDLADLPLDRYLTPAPVLCIQASRGCYYGKCSFCDAYWGVTLDKKPIHRVVKEMAHLRERYGIRHFEFIDECLPPEEMEAMSAAIAEAGLDVRWFANARLEPGFVQAAPGIARGGATMLLWGFETGSPRILKKTAKGVDLEGRWNVLRAANEAGLWNFAYIFFGFPGETDDDADATIDAICQNTHLIHSYGRSVFSLGLHSPMARRPESFGVSEVRDVGDELSVNISFHSEAGPTPEQVTASVDRCTDRCREAYGSPLWMGLRNRENLHLYLDRFGAEKVHRWSIGPHEETAVSAFQK